MFTLTSIAFALLALKAQAAPPPSATIDPLSVGTPVPSANATFISPSRDLIKAESLSSEEFRYYVGWDGKVLDPSAIGTPADTNTTLSARALGGVYLCEHANWGQPCGYAVQPLSTCINLGSDWNNKISSIGPDAGTKLTVYDDFNCVGTRTPVQHPGGTAQASWNDRISSFEVFADPETEPRGVYICENANWGQPCGYAKQPIGVCINLGSDWNDKISAIGPDPDSHLLVFRNANCDYAAGYSAVYNPGWASLAGSSWNDDISSFLVLYG